MVGRFVIAVKDLAAGGSDFVFPLTEGWLQGALQECGVAPVGPPGQAKVRATRTGTSVLLEGAVEVDLASTCVRCLEPASIRIDSTFSVLMTQRTAASAPEEEDDDKGDRETFEGDEIVLDDLVREHVLLEVPMNPVCSEACTGVALEPGVLDKVDPRLAPLVALRKKI